MQHPHLALCLLMLFTTSGFADTYRWVDENGVVSYSQTKPTSADAEVVKLRSPSPGSANDANTRLNNLRQRLEDNREDRQLAKETQRDEGRESARRQKNCEAARTNLTRLEGLGNRLLRTADGQYLKLTEEERQSRMQQARDDIKANCSN